MLGFFPSKEDSRSSSHLEEDVKNMKEYNLKRGSREKIKIFGHCETLRNFLTSAFFFRDASRFLTVPVSLVRENICNFAASIASISRALNAAILSPAKIQFNLGLVFSLDAERDKRTIVNRYHLKVFAHS